jgi:TatD DNase family protein
MSSELKIFDTHCHINFSEYDSDRDEVVKRAKSAGVGAFIIGTGAQTSTEAAQLAQKYDSLWAIVGIHPVHVSDQEHEGKIIKGEKYDASIFEKLIAEPRVIGVGECGFDFYHNEPITFSAQKEVFEAQMNLAQKYAKPVMFHIRNPQPNDTSWNMNAYEEAYKVAQAFPNVRGNVHFFAGTQKDAQKFLDLGYTISFTGVITFAPMYQELVAYVPLDRIMSETDAPYVAPVPVRGQRAEPAHVVHVIEAIARFKGVSYEEAVIVLNTTTRTHYGI